MTTTKKMRWFWLVLVCAACSSGERGGTTETPSPGTSVTGPGTSLTVNPPADRTQELEALDADLAELAGITSAELLEQHPVNFEAAPTYDLGTVQGLDLIASKLGLAEDELAGLAARGFTVTDRHRFPTFAYGYETIYMNDLPVYVSADSILTAVHQSYDSLLESLELAALGPELESLLEGMRSRLASGAGSELGDSARADADVFLAVALSLLLEETAAPVAGGSKETIDALVAKANAASGLADIELFGVVRQNEDFSQFEPRGHYTDSPELERYFRAMMWLGRIDFRLLEAQSDGTLLFRRRQVEGMLLLHGLIDADLRQRFDRIDRTVAAFVGEPDYMVLSEVDELMAALGASQASDVTAKSDQEIAQAIVDGGFGAQRISSHVMINGVGGTLPLSASFALLGQRYVVDSHVFSNVVYDRAGGGTVLRMMPNPLDVAFAALGNDQAAALLAPELDTYAYAPDLGAMRLLVDRHDQEFWQENLYNRWLGALRELSPAAALGSVSDLPAVARSEAWGLRLQNTQLASWAELRHDTILYAKQSYTGGPSCEFPDGYVDPYPDFFRAITAYAEHGRGVMQALDLSTAGGAIATQAVDYFSKLAEVSTQLAEMAEYERTGSAFTTEMMDFINDAVVIDEICGGATFTAGWYRQLFFNPGKGVEFDPTIADVHTQPFDETGGEVGKVLHVGTGMPRLMVTIADNCSGPRAYAGLVSAYFERVTEDFERLTDPEWKEDISAATPADVPWMSDLVVR